MWLLKMVARVILPMIFQSLMNKAQTPPGQQQYRKSNQPPSQSKLHIDFIPPQDKEAKAADKAGEFIDYEEIKTK